jgi:hypothetical protein
MIAKHIALFDAIADLSDSGSHSHQLHDDDGSIVKTMRLWAETRGLEVNRRTQEIVDGDNPRRWDVYEVTFAPGRYLVVHDSTSRRSVERLVCADSTWRPFEACQ